MLQVDVRVTARDANTRNPLDNYTEQDLDFIQWLVENAIDETQWELADGRKIILTIAMSSVVK